MEWRTAYNYSDYEVSNTGLVRRKTKNKLSSRWPQGRHLTRQLNHSGYYRVKLNHKYVFVAKLVAEAFIHPRINDEQVNHKDFNKINNSINNLEWVTRLENMRHAYANGRVPKKRGEDHPNAKLNEKAVREIRATTGQTQKLADKYKVDRSLIKYVRNRTIWIHVA